MYSISISINRGIFPINLLFSNEFQHDDQEEIEVIDIGIIINLIDDDI